MSKKLLAALLAVCMVASLLFVPASAAATFDDVANNHWASGAIERWAGYGVLNGNGDGTFAPENSMTRAEFAKMLVNMLGLTAKSDKTFSDVDADAWYAEVVSIAVKAGIINGKTPTSFAPNDPVSFEEAVVMMCRAFGLAETTDGADWSKGSIEKLTSLGMIGEGADEHLQVGVDCNRAIVAALADAVVAEYVSEDRAEPITGEIKGVVLVVKGAKAEIKDATLVAPVVAESAQVTLTNTKADAVIVSGKDAAVAADEASSVASVTLAGEAPKADIKGEVGSVTIAEETTGAVVDAPKADAIVNNSAEEATVNGETVEGKTEEPANPENPDDEGDYNGSVSGGGDTPSTPSVPEDSTTGTTGGDKAEDDRSEAPTATPVENNDGLTAATGKELCEANAHEWGTGTVTTAAKCGTAGTATYTCSKCGATKTQEITALEHDFDNSTRTSWDASKHYKVCKYCDEKNAGEDHTLTYTDNGDTHTGKCTCGYTKTDTHTPSDWQTTDTVHLGVCNVCGTAVSKAHTFNDWVNNTEGGNHKHTCNVCSKEVTENHDWSKKDGACTVCDATCDHDGTAAGATCATCGYKVPEEEEDPPAEKSHTCDHSSAKGSYTPAADGKTCSHTCTVSDQGTHSKEVDTQTHTSGSQCEFCGKTFTAPEQGDGNWTENS